MEHVLSYLMPVVGPQDPVAEQLNRIKWAAAVSQKARRRQDQVPDIPALDLFKVKSLALADREALPQNQSLPIAQGLQNLPDPARNLHVAVYILRAQNHLPVRDLYSQKVDRKKENLKLQVLQLPMVPVTIHRKVVDPGAFLRKEATNQQVRRVNILQWKDTQNLPHLLDMLNLLRKLLKEQALKSQTLRDHNRKAPKMIKVIMNPTNLSNRLVCTILFYEFSNIYMYSFDISR